MSAGQSQLGFDPLTSQSTLIGHSEGSFAVTFARDRLNTAGLGAAIGKVVTLGGALGPIPPGLQGLKAFYTFGKLVASKLPNNPDVNSYLNFIQGLSNGTISLSKYIPMVDLGVGGVMGKGGLLSSKYVRPTLRLLAKGEDFITFLANPWKFITFQTTGDEATTDGFIPIELSKVGVKSMQLAGNIDHGFLIENWNTVDEWVAAL